MAGLREREQYETVCKPEFEEIKESLCEIKKFLFVGNSKPSWAVRMDRAERMLGVICWFAAAGILAAIGIVVKNLFGG